MHAATYETLLFDLDHTLFDTDASEAQAFDRTLRAAGAANPKHYFPTYDRINRALWSAVERGETTPGQVRSARFEQLVAATKLTADPAAMADDFVAGLGTCGDLYPGAGEVLASLADRTTLALVTNGLSEVQRARLQRVGIADLFTVVIISAEVGVSKPAPRIFDLTFDALGSPDRATAVMIGDSLTSDIQGAMNAGVATCWYNRHGHGRSETHRVDHELSRLEQLLDLV